jgi:uncharacterized membrane protein YccF (DUF307 family)
MTSLMTDQVREFLVGQADAERSGEIGGIVIVLALVLLGFQSILSSTGSSRARALTVVTVPVALLTVAVVAVRLDWLAS